MNFDVELVGAWSTNALYDATTQPNRIVAFKNDGTGWMASANHGVGEMSRLEWSPSSPRWVSIWTTRSFELLSGGRKREIDKAPDIWHLPFAVTIETAASYQEIEVLRIEIWSFGDNTFGRLEANSSLLQAPF